MLKRNHSEPLRVVITGASSGIGQAAAELFARRGAHVVLAARNIDALDDVVARCRAVGAEATAVRADVTDIGDVRCLADVALAQLGSIDVWVSNVGVGAIGRYQDTPIDAHEKVIRTNLIGHMNDAHVVLPIFLEQHRGTFINMISLGAFAAAPYAVAYSASKFGLRGFSEALRGELADQPDIHICDVYPGFVDTPGLRHGANFVRRQISSPPPVLDPWRVAAAIVRLADKPRNTTLVGSTAVFARGVHALSPSLTSRAMARFMSAYFNRAEPVELSDGNLFDPSPDAAVVEGGLRRPRKRAAASGIVGIGAAAAGVLALKRGRIAARQ
jgi:short-subunit dehydrogenase